MSNIAIACDTFGGGASGAATIASVLGSALLADYNPIAANITLDGSNNVQTWAAVGGTPDTNRNATQATATHRPLYTASNALVAGAPTVDGRSDSNSILRTGIWAHPIAGPTMIFIVGWTPSVLNAEGTYFMSGQNDTDTLGILCRGTNPVGRAAMTNQAVTLDAGIQTTTTPAIYTCVFNGNSSSIAVGQNTPQNTGNAGPGSANGLVLMSYDAVGFGLVGSVARIVVANYDANRIAGVTAVLAKAYGLTQGP